MKWILLFALSFFSLSAWSEKPPVPAELDRAYVESLAQLSAKLTECQHSERSIDISPLVSKGYSKDVIKAVVAYSYAQAKYACSESEYQAYLVFSNAYGAFLSADGEENKAKVDALITSYEKYRWGAIQAYSELPDEVKVFAESLDTLKQPFELFSVLDQLNEIK